MLDSDSAIGNISGMIPLLTGIGIRIRNLENSWKQKRTVIILNGPCWKTI